MSYASSSHHKHSKRKRSPTPESRRQEHHKRRQHSPRDAPSTSGDGFSFEQYKRSLNKIFSYSSESNTVVNNLDDFWIFLKKYESTLRKAGKPIVEAQYEDSVYSKFHCINFTSKMKFVDTYDERGKRLDKKLFDSLLNIVSVYLDFKNKEKFEKLRKLRQAQRELPVAKFREEIVSAVKERQVVIVAGDTGCGKSTQVPQYLLQGGFESIACTQPRRIACVSLSKRVAFETLTQFESLVGYQIRFERSKTADTKICFVTEGLLLRQLSSSAPPPYSVIILDEVHERHLSADFLLGVLKCAVRAQPDLRLVLMSATINVDLFASYFAAENCAVIEVPGRLFPIELHYRPPYIENKPTKSDRLDPQPYVQIMQMIDNKYPAEERGDMLVFLSGAQEITAVVDAAQQYAAARWVVLPLHSGLSVADQDKVFHYPPEGVRKCVVSTNVAETSVTIDGIRFVVDSGKVKEMSYDPSTRMQRLKEFWVSRASADQRKGRAGRTGPGVCFRLYSEEQYSSLEAFSTPEVARVPLASLLLTMTSLGMSDVRRFPFVDAPPEASVETALLELKQHGALTSNEKLTPLGRTLSRIPVEVPLAKAIVVASASLPPHKVDAALALAGALGIRSIYTTRAHKDAECENARAPDESDHGDPPTLLALYCGWLHARGAGSGRAWCRRRGLEEQRLYELTKLVAKLRVLLQDCNLLETSEPESMTSAERAMRHGELKQLKDMRRKFKQKAAEDTKKKQRLKVDSWEIVDESKIDEDIDIRDVEFRLTNDAARIRSLMAGTSTSSGRDMTMLKLILCRALYPQIAIADEFNHCKSVSDQLYHTQSKPYLALHPNSYFGRHPRALALPEDAPDPPPGYRTRLALSSKHQLLCYLSLLETTKPYVVNSMRAPAAQTLLLLAHALDTDAGVTRVVVDSWLLLEFPLAGGALAPLRRAARLRRRWERLIELRVADVDTEKSLETELKKPEQKQSYDEIQHELSCDMAAFLNCELYYTVKRLLPGDLKVLYRGAGSGQVNVHPNPFEEGFEGQAHERKGGVYVTDNIVYNCIVDTDWSYSNYQQMYTDTPWTCDNCSLSVCLSPIERLQHTEFMCSERKVQAKPEATTSARENKPNAKEYNCENCGVLLYLTPVEILRHKKACVKK